EDVSGRSHAAREELGIETDVGAHVDDAIPGAYEALDKGDRVALRGALVGVVERDVNGRTVAIDEVRRGGRGAYHGGPVHWEARDMQRRRRAPAAARFAIL